MLSSCRMPLFVNKVKKGGKSAFIPSESNGISSCKCYIATNVWLIVSCFRAFKQMSAQRFDYVHRLLPKLKLQSEDCLYMNIFVPERLGECIFEGFHPGVLRQKNTDDKLPTYNSTYAAGVRNSAWKIARLT